MDWQALRAKYNTDQDMPLRTARLDALTAVLAGQQYDAIEHPFSLEKTSGGDYVPLSERRPSVRSGICATVVDESVSLLFGEGHFPSVVADDDDSRSAVADLIREACLPELMIDLATRGSVGSIAVLFQVIDFCPVFTVMPTPNLTPTFQPARPKVLASLTERYKVRGYDLRAQGYQVDEAMLTALFWFQRDWDDQNEIWYLPQTMEDAAKGRALNIDGQRSVQHGLGFVPAIWIKNLPGGTAPDGACTFEDAIDTVIELDYLLSQAGRGLKYASDPQIVLKASASGDQPSRMVGGSASALRLPPDGDAKLLEINGHAAATVLEHVRYLRSLALEAIHGNRADSDRVTAAQSGRAMELMHQALIWLVGRLKLSYGEQGLLALLRMVCAASQKVEAGLTIGEKTGIKLNPTGLELRWPAFFPPTNADLLQTAQALVTAVDGSILSQETAIQQMSGLTDVDDAAEELARVQKETQAKQQQAMETMQATANAQQVAQAANAGKSETHQLTA